MRIRLLFLFVIAVLIGGARSALACTDDAGCPAGQYCYRGRCFTGSSVTCSADTDCAASQICVRGRCWAVECTDDTGCPAGQFCYQHQCLAGSATPCSDDAACQAAGEWCSGGRCLVLECKAHCDCPQGSFCYYGRCLTDPKTPVYCCSTATGNPKDGCPPGRWCFEPSGGRGTCAELTSYFCTSACDCGPAHCCKNNVCVKDVDDAWNPGGVEVGESCTDDDATYCCSDPLCWAGWDANDATFLCSDSGDQSARPVCGERPCFDNSWCDPGESCMFLNADHTGTLESCSRDAGQCMSNAVAEAVFGISPAELLPVCEKGCFAGQWCVYGWRSGGAYAIEPVIGRCGSCGNTVCERWETWVSCPADCTPSCGNGICNGPETPKNCPSDCPVTCGDGSCSSVELSSCPEDCGCPDSAIYSDIPIFCGDGVCQDFGDFPEDCVNCPHDCNSNQDGDAFLDCVDTCPLDAKNDEDEDGLCANADNCPTTANADQANHDADADGDACDADDDGDTVPDVSDNCPLTPNAGQADFDLDGIGDACDSDADNDGVENAADRCAGTAAGAVVASSGCSVAQTCPCDRAWKNRGAYLSCVARAADSLLAAGLIDEATQQALVAAAASSNCGKR